jgi:Lecithin:cholesterol acyltransferase
MQEDDGNARLHEEEEGSETSTRTTTILFRRNNSFPGALSDTTTTTSNSIFVGRNNPQAQAATMTNFITHLTGDDSESGIVEAPSSEKSPFPQLQTPMPPPLPRPPRGLAWRRTISAPTEEQQQHQSVGTENTTTADASAPTVAVVVRESLKRKIIRRTLFAICIFFGQVFVSVALKRYGIIEKDLNQVMTERFAPAVAGYMPDMQALELRIQETIESARLIAPGFNDTMYWLRLNNQLSELRQDDSNESTTKSSSTSTTTGLRLRPGQKLAEKGAVGQHPIVMIPGFVTSGLEVWKGKDCMENGFFRQRVWGGWHSAQYWLRHAMCMMKNLALDPITGGDPDGIKLRSAEGFTAADFFVGNDWFTANYW